MSRQSTLGLSVLSCLVGATACDEAGHPETLIAAGGGLTVQDRSSNAFRNPGPNLDSDELARHVAGDAAFESVFVTAPAPVNAGLGPVFNHTNCSGCHPRDGRGLAVIGAPPQFSPMLVRVSLPHGEPEAPGGVVPVPGFGTQLQDHAIFGATPEVLIALSWEVSAGEYGDGTPYELRVPRLVITRADGSPMPDGVLYSARIPSPVFGLGLLEAVPVAAIEALADPDDADRDGVSGRPNLVYDERLRASVIGRFGWKANAIDLERQVAAAYANDMGVTSPIHSASDGTSDIDAETLALTTFYVQTLGVPAPAVMSGQAKRGEALFGSMGCATCHVPLLETGPHPLKALEHQVIQPFTDLLLHDMGPGLADGRRDWEASGSEWRTAPLWGLGLTATVLPLATYLHDGRARNLEEAILWHGGEAESMREAFRMAREEDRDALLAFLRSL